MDGRPGINSRMKTTFRQFLTESRIQIPATTHREAMRIVAAAYFSDLQRRMRIEGDEPTPEFERALQDAQSRYGDFQLHNLTRDNPALQGQVVFNTKELPERYRKNLSKDFAVVVSAGPRGAKGDSGSFQPAKRGQNAIIRINTMSGGSPDSAMYNPKLIAQQLDYLDSTLDHELQHMVQDTALKRLHPSQGGNDETRKAGAADDDVYYNSNEEYLPQITTAAATFRKHMQGVQDREQIKDAFLDSVDPRRGGNTFPFFASLFKSNTAQWKKAVKELHRLVQSRM